MLCEVGVAYTVDVELCDHNKQASTVPRTRWRSLKVGHSVQTILQRPLIIMFERARFLDSLFFPDH